jgi:hypothetical protein
MATNEDKLNEGPPAIDTSILPENLPTTDQTNYGLAFQALLGVKTTAENQFGSAILRIPVTTTGQSVTANTAQLTIPGAVIAVQATTGSFTGALILSVTGSVDAGTCRVTYDAKGIPLLTFNATDAVTECSFVQIPVPEAFVDALQATNP